MLETTPGGRSVCLSDASGPARCIMGVGAMAMLRKLASQLSGKLSAALWRRQTLKVYDGIRIVDRSFRKDLRREFVLRTCQALDLVSRTDPRRYRRIRRYLRFIVHSELAFAFAQYSRCSSACILDFAKLIEDLAPRTVRRSVFLLAATLVHEATHGRLLGLTLKRTPEAPARMERLCIIEEMRFAERVGPEFGKAYKAVYSDWSNWQQRFQARPRTISWPGFMALLRRKTGSARRANQPRQPTPGACLAVHREPLTRRGCADR